MSRRAIAVVGFVVWARTSEGQTLSNQAVDAAIKAGQAKKFDHLVSSCTAKAGAGEAFTAGVSGGVQRTGTFDVVVSTNAGRIAFLAADAKRLYKSFGVADVTEELRTPGVFVSVEPNKPDQFVGHDLRRGAHRARRVEVEEPTRRYRSTGHVQHRAG